MKVLKKLRKFTVEEAEHDETVSRTPTTSDDPKDRNNCQRFILTRLKQYEEELAHEA